MMAQECSGGSMAISPSAQQVWWEIPHEGFICSNSWCNPCAWNQSNPSSNLSSGEDVSISTSLTNASNHSGLTADSSFHLLVEPASSDELIMQERSQDNQLWRQILLVTGSNNREWHYNQDGMREGLLDSTPLKKTVSWGISEPTCDHSSKMNYWEFRNSMNNLEKSLTYPGVSLTGSGRLSKLSNFVDHLSIAPPDPDVDAHLGAFAPNMLPSTCIEVYGNNRCANRNPAGLQYSAYPGNPRLECESDLHHLEANGSILKGNGDENRYTCGVPIMPCTSSGKRFPEEISLGHESNKPLVEVQLPKVPFKPFNLSGPQKQELQPFSTKAREQGTCEGKRRRSEDTSRMAWKKSKHEIATIPTVKVPKVKLSERITALQQIVSPFGRTDTASVLYEAIQYIKFLQEQVQLLSNPFMKTNSHKFSFQDRWVGSDRKDQKEDAKHDLRSRGLSLVPVSCIPKAYHENTGSDYWTPTYKGCLYR